MIPPNFVPLRAALKIIAGNEQKVALDAAWNRLRPLLIEGKVSFWVPDDPKASHTFSPADWADPVNASADRTGKLIHNLTREGIGSTKSVVYISTVDINTIFGDNEEIAAKRIEGRSATAKTRGRPVKYDKVQFFIDLGIIAADDWGQERSYFINTMLDLYSEAGLETGQQTWVTERVNEFFNRYDVVQKFMPQAKRNLPRKRPERPKRT